MRRSFLSTNVVLVTSLNLRSKISAVSNSLNLKWRISGLFPLYSINAVSNSKTCRSALKVTEVDLVAAKTHVDQFKEISQASEAALVVLNTTFDEYKASSEASIVRHEVSLSFSKISCKKIISR